MKVYQWFAKLPCTDLAAIDRQLRLAVEYQRALTQIEIDRRKVIEKVYTDALPQEHAACAEAERQTEVAVLALRAARSFQAVKVEKGDEDAREDVKAAKDALVAAKEIEKSAREAKRLARKALTPTIKDKLKAFDTDAYAARKVAYNAPDFEELAWGTKLVVGESVERAAKASAMEGTLPRMPTFDGSGAIAVQLQGGLAPSDVAEDTRFRLEQVSREAWMTAQQASKRLRLQAQIAEGFHRPVKSGDGITGNDGKLLPMPKSDSKYSSRSGGIYLIAHLRIGSDGRAPIWASWPLVAKIARPLPKDVVIKWAKMLAVKTGTRIEWKLQVTVDEPEVEKKTVGGTLAVNLGWRNLEDGGIRVAYAVGSDGREEEVRVPEAFVSRLAHVESIRSTRDRLCDSAHAALRDWITDREEPLPKWLAEATRWMANWRGPKQLARLVRDWQRFDGDEGIYRALSMWRNGKNAAGHSVGNHHLRFWESDEREKAYRYRNEFYRQIAIRWSREYAHIFVTDMDLRDFAKEPEPEEGRRSDGSVQRRTRTLAGPSILRGEIERACASEGRCCPRLVTRRGKQVEEGSCAEHAGVTSRMGPFKTQTCAACGTVERFDAKHQLVRTCSSCGTKDDQDRNHGLCILASAEVIRDQARALAPSVEGGAQGGLEKKEGRWKRRRSQSGRQVVGSSEVVG